MVYRLPQKNEGFKPYVAKKMNPDPDRGCIVCSRTNCPRHGERAKEYLNKCNHHSPFGDELLERTLVHCTVCGLDPLFAYANKPW